MLTGQKLHHHRFQYFGRRLRGSTFGGPKSFTPWSYVSSAASFPPMLQRNHCSGPKGIQNANCKVQSLQPRNLAISKPVVRQKSNLGQSLRLCSRRTNARSARPMAARRVATGRQLARARSPPPFFNASHVIIEEFGFVSPNGSALFLLALPASPRSS